ncbi:MAG: nucleoside transporter C-terminal domain-containing protein [Gemmatimonadota bacterium]|nr:nucleoside transporter C-terminal domain-containing protein [Gemmatimonadota bacterium]
MVDLPGRSFLRRRGNPSRALPALWALAAILLASGWVAGRGGGAAPASAVPVAQDTLARDTAADAAPGDTTAVGPARPIGAAPRGSLRAEPDTAAAAPAMDQAGERAAEARAELDTAWWQRAVSLLGLGVMVLLAWLVSVERGRFPARVVLWGIGLQLLFAVLILRTGPGEEFFALVNTAFIQLLGYTQDGARFIFGNLVENNIPVGVPVGEPPEMAPIEPAAENPRYAAAGSYFAFTVLPTIIFFSSFMTVLYHLKIMQGAVKGMAWVMQRTMGTSGAETLSASGNIFVGQTEAPLMIKPFVEKMTMSELHCVMTGGFATVAGGVMAAYVGMLVTYFPDIAGHLLAASVMSAPAAILISKVMYPELGEPETAETLKADVPSPDVNVIDAATRGAGDGLRLALNVGAMLLAFIALIALVNALVGWGGGLLGYPDLSLELILGWTLAPLAWVMGVPWGDAVQVGSLLGVKTVVNEFVAYLQLASLLQADAPLEPRSIVIATYALAGFANFSSIAIQIGGIGGIAPSRRSDLSKIGLRAMIGGTLAAFMTATVAGAIL